MTGVVIARNISRGMVVAKTDEGCYSVIELIGGYDVELGDQLRGSLHDEGSEVVQNLSQNEAMDTYIQAVFGDKRYAIEMIR